MAEEQKAAPEGAVQQQQFQIQRIYTKDISFETPNSPKIFSKEWKPDVKLDLDTRSNKLDENVFEVVLAITATATVDGETAFLCEVQQAGIFAIGQMPEANIAHMIGSYCPNVLFPYARETIASLVNKGTFPPLNLAPVNFDAIFAAYVKKRKQQADAEKEAAPKLDS